MQLSVIIVSWNTCAMLRRCLVSLKQELGNLQSEVFLIDNNSSDGSAQMVAAEHPWVKLTANRRNRGFAAANNQALSQAQGNYIMLLNPDCEVMPGAIYTLIEFMQQHPQAAIVAPQLLNTDGSIQRSCRQFPTFAGMFFELLGFSKLFPRQPIFSQYKMLDFDHRFKRQVDQPQGASLLVRRSAIEQVGVFDEGYFMLFEEVDWCYRFKQAGWEIWFTPAAQIMHHYGQSIKQVKVKMIFSSHRGLYYFWRKHYCQKRWYLAGLVHFGLMLLAYLRVLSFYVKTCCNNLRNTKRIAAVAAMKKR